MVMPARRLRFSSKAFFDKIFNAKLAKVAQSSQRNVWLQSRSEFTALKLVVLPLKIDQE